MQGNRLLNVERVFLCRDYPRACGGPFPPSASFFSSKGLSPRVRGNLIAPDDDNAHVGLSPRVRGNRSWIHRQWADAGSIPACAGEPNAEKNSTQTDRVYPRGCGETVTEPGT